MISSFINSRPNNSQHFVRFFCSWVYMYVAWMKVLQDSAFEKLTWVFSPVHAGVSGNERADTLAGTAPASTQSGPQMGPIWVLHGHVGPISFPHSPHGPHLVFTWGNVGMWCPCLSHIAHMGPIWFLRGVMWGPHKNRINTDRSRETIL